MTRTAAALREGAWGVAGFALAGLALALFEALAYHRVAPTGADRASFAYYLTTQAPLAAVMFPPPVRPDTAAGYVQMMAFAPLAILFAYWAVASAVSFVTSRARQRDFIGTLTAFAISALIATVAACAGAALGIASGGEQMNVAGAIGAGLILVVFAIACYALCILVAQLTPEPAIVTTGVMMALFFLNSLSRVFAQLSYARWVSPFRYLDMSAPLPPGGHFDLGGFAMLITIAVAGSALALLRSRTDATLRPNTSKTFESSSARLLDVPVARDLYLRRRAFVAWSLAAVVLGAFLAAAARTSIQPLLLLPPQLPGIHQLIAGMYAVLLGRMWFDVTLLLFGALALVFVSRWSAEDSDGRLATMLSAPYSRATVVVERVAALSVASAGLAALSALAVLLTSRAGGVSVDGVRLVDACVLLVLFATIVGAAGSLFATWVPRAATALTGVFVLAGYLDDQVGGSLGWPGWLRSLSPFNLVREPILVGIDGRRLTLMVALAAVGLASSILLMQRRDVGLADLRKVANPVQRR